MSNISSGINLDSLTYNSDSIFYILALNGYTIIFACNLNITILSINIALNQDICHWCNSAFNIFAIEFTIITNCLTTIVTSNLNYAIAIRSVNRSIRKVCSVAFVQSVDILINFSGIFACDILTIVNQLTTRFIHRNRVNLGHEVGVIFNGDFRITLSFERATAFKVVGIDGNVTTRTN